LKISFAPVHTGYTVAAPLKRMFAFFYGQFYGNIDHFKNDLAIFFLLRKNLWAS
jgi:hypothetical protein